MRETQKVRCGARSPSGAAGCNSGYGYLQTKNGNCERCASPFVPCLMAANT